jgi:hypothetical protein
MPVDQNVCDQIIQHVCKMRPKCPLLMAVYPDGPVVSVVCSVLGTDSVILQVLHENAFAAKFLEILRPQGRPKYIAVAGHIANAHDPMNPTGMGVCITDPEGRDSVTYSARLQQCKCCFGTLTVVPGDKSLPRMLGLIASAYRLSSPTPAPIYSKPVHEVKFSRS